MRRSLSMELLLDLLFRCKRKMFQKYYPKRWSKMAMNPMLQSAKNHQQQQIQVLYNPLINGRK